MPTPSDLRARARELLKLADEMEAMERRAAELTGGRTAPTMANMDIDAIPDAPSHRRGVKLVAEDYGEARPYAIAALNAGLTLKQLADKLGIGYSAIKMRNINRYADPKTRELLAKKPYLVPYEAWPPK